MGARYSKAVQCVLAEVVASTIKQARSINLGRTVVPAWDESVLTSVEALTNVGAVLMAKLAVNLISKRICIGAGCVKAVALRKGELGLT